MRLRRTPDQDLVQAAERIDPSSASQVINVYPVSVRSKRLCQAEPWGHEGYTTCPFLRTGFCRLWGFNVDRRPDLAASCSVSKVLVPLSDD